MLRLLMLIFSTVVFALLAGDWLIHTHQLRWAEAAVAVFIATFIPFVDTVVPLRRTQPPVQ